MPKVSFLGQSHGFSSSDLPLIFWIALAFFSGLISRHAFLDYVAWANSPVCFNIRVRRFDSKYRNSNFRRSLSSRYFE
jgi:hypothetical protein